MTTTFFSSRVEQSIERARHHLQNAKATARSIARMDINDALFHLEEALRLMPSEKATVPDGWKLVCEKCGADSDGPCGWPTNCPTGMGKSWLKR